jgi:hypothetical protein
MDLADTAISTMSIGFGVGILLMFSAGILLGFVAWMRSFIG